MKKICIAQGGPFLLGIDHDKLIACRSWPETVAQAEKEDKIFQLDALLSRQVADTVSAEAVCLELRSGQDRVFLVADRIVADEVEIISLPSRLPSVCPALTARLCPQVTVWEDTPVLLLEPMQIIPVAAELGEGIGVLTKDMAEEHAAMSAADDDAASELDSKPDAKEEEQDDPFFPAMESETEASSEVLACTSPLEVNESEEQPQPQPALESRKKEAKAIDEEIFKQVMTWTISRFKQQGGKAEELRLGIEQLPPELAGLVERKGLNKNVIEYLMEQIVLRCKEIRKKAGDKDAG